ncbi:pilin N-terminal domain-containing protein [Enterococcus durans]|uniref:pilin N-terminal domain-containing protein n=1 Tax=Enterococcus durans TaxID=53345 RepID=UPI0039A53F74
MKRTGKGRFNIVLGLFVVLIPFLLASTGADVSADDTTSKDTTVTLHKLGYDKDQYPDQAIDNTGDSLADDGTVKAGTPIKGVVFTAYDRTDRSGNGFSSNR